MATLADFLRSFKPEDLISYFRIKSIPLPDDIPWQGPVKRRVEKLQTALDDLGSEVVEKIHDDAERIAFMSDEAGQNAIYSVTAQRDVLDALESSPARALWLLLNDPPQFAHAEEARFADGRRLGRQWSGYIGPKDVAVHRNGPALEALSQAVSTHFNSKRVFIEVCDRTRIEDDKTKKLLQVAIYRETRAEMRRQFVGGQLDRTPDRPVVEAAITYEPHSGLIEAVASNKEDRLKLARMFCEHLMEQPLTGERVRLRRFDLDVLRKPFRFLTEPEDQIEGVQLKSLRLIP